MYLHVDFSYMTATAAILDTGIIVMLSTMISHGKAFSLSRETQLFQKDNGSTITWLLLYCLCCALNTILLWIQSQDTIDILVIYSV